MGGFGRDARKAENGFVFRENCFVAFGATKQSAGNPNHFKRVAPLPKAALQVPARAWTNLERRRRHAPAFRASHAFYVFLLKEAERRLGPVEPGALRLRPKPSKSRRPESPDAFT
ncbi:hypothetical protein [Bradyrhizobium sp. 1(2017)]|uniref:hypothetical protein n=1 Tax=Bradyrhizobium sp. 1(2017) TaxID=1404888 RepID=UPI00140F439C|nr:hypothetical protein [Bradyrhizobium sp. 1(2017)]QIO34413.1 hypothetical protein HAP40_22730 [Bradyrhizobium sp. 1(2017)]